MREREVPFFPEMLQVPAPRQEDFFADVLLYIGEKSDRGAQEDEVFMEKMVRFTGLEPVTPCMSCKYSTN
jgi:hypothetical protein